MKILYVLEYYFPHIGGVETLFQNLAEGMVERGHKVRVITNHLKDTKKEENLKGVEIKRIKFPKAKRFFFTFFSFPFILKYGKEADIIHSSTYGGVFSASLSATLLRKPSILSVHEIWLEEWKRVPFVSKFQKLTGSFQEFFLLNLPFSLKVTESQYTLNKLNKISPGNNLKIPAGVKVPEDLKWNKKREEIFKYLYFGRPGHWRGVDLLVKAFEELEKEIEKVKLILILSKEPEKEYKEIMEIISSCKVKEKIKIMEPLEREELFKFLMGVDCVVIPSLSEGFGLAAAEASALFVPIISSDAGSLPEVVSGKCLFFKKGDIFKLKDKMIKAHRGEWEWKAKKEFKMDKFLNSWDNIYRGYEK
ncbi:MAG: glycosyltransferase family 4 protein [Thermoanaerobaculia bacterium]